MAESTAPKDASCAATLYCQLLGKVIQATQVDTHTMSSIKWQVFQTGYMDKSTLAIFQKIEEHYEGKIWKGFVKGKEGYRIYVKPDESILTDDFEWQITGFECFQPKYWMKTDKYSGNIGFCLKLS